MVTLLLLIMDVVGYGTWDSIMNIVMLLHISPADIADKYEDDFDDSKQDE